MEQILLLDSAGPVVGVAAFVGDTLVYSASERVAAGTEAWLSDVLAEALPTVPRLALVGVTVGPGAFTGIRVGVAAALGVAFARALPVAPLSSLALRACLAPGAPRVLSILDARKGRVYAGWFDTRGEVPAPLGPERDVSIDAALEGTAGVAVGEGAVAFGAIVTAAGNVVRADAADSPVRAGAALCRAIGGQSAETVGPRYLREPDARPRQV